MQFVKPDVSTICIGQAASMGAVLLAGGAKGKRFALPHARMMIHQPLGGFQGQAADMEIHAREMLYTRDRLNKILARHTGQSVDAIKKDTDRDNFMAAADAVSYGLIDKILESRGEIRATVPGKYVATVRYKSHRAQRLTCEEALCLAASRTCYKTRAHARHRLAQELRCFTRAIDE